MLDRRALLRGLLAAPILALLPHLPRFDFGEDPDVFSPGLIDELVEMVRTMKPPIFPDYNGFYVWLHPDATEEEISVTARWIGCEPQQIQRQIRLTTEEDDP